MFTFILIPHFEYMVHMYYDFDRDIIERSWEPRIIETMIQKTVGPMLIYNRTHNARDAPHRFN